MEEDVGNWGEGGVGRGRRTKRRSRVGCADHEGEAVRVHSFQP